MKPLYIVGTQRDVGKTTLSIGLVHALRNRGLRVSYTKPLGQRASTVQGQTLHDDERVIASMLGADDFAHMDMVVPIESGRVEKEIYESHPEQLMAQMAANLERLQKDHDLVIVEAMGHVAMGSVMGMSSADVARRIGARALLVSGGGIGRAIDDISLCSTFIAARGADLMGVVVNKVWAQKYDRVKEATTRALRKAGLSPLGTVPYEDKLSSPTMRQVHEEIGGDVISGGGLMGLRVLHTIVAAMLAEHMTGYIQRGTLVITPGDRSDNIIAAINVANAEGTEPAVSGLILTGGFEPDPAAREAISRSNIPVVVIGGDTYAVATKVRETVFKITPDDHERIDAAVALVAQHVDIDAIVDGLR